MPITVKRLIAELEKIDNKFLEVEVFVKDANRMMQPLQNAKVVNKKVLLFTEEPKNAI